MSRTDTAEPESERGPGRATTVDTVSGRGSAGPTEAACRLVTEHAPGPAAEPVTLSRDGVLAIGRDVDAPGLLLRDARASRLHARITYDARSGGFRFGDAGSSNGTFHNGARTDTAVLRHGDVLRIGDTVMVTEHGDPVREMRERAERVAASDLSILLHGESGSGKEVLARRIHEHSGRSGAFVALNCAAVPRDLVASELFGHTKAAFSGAETARAGVFGAAEGGTLLLDEIGDLPLSQQPALLRALQERAIRPVGADREVPVDVRVLAATHFDLQEQVENGEFRADLYSRLAELVIRVPPLRERRSEVVALLREFVSQRLRPFSITADAAEALTLWEWPYNVRELRSFARAFVALSRDGQRLDQEFLRANKPEPLAHLRTQPVSETETSAGPAVSRERLKGLLREHSGNVSAVADSLGKTRAQVYRWLRHFGLSAAAYRK